MITFYENNPQNQMRYHQRKPDELSFLSDDEEDTTIGFSKKKRMSQLTATDSAYFSESSNQATTLINPKENSPSPTPHHNVILWQKQQQHYQKQNNGVPSPSITPTQSFDNGNDITSITPDTIPHTDDWDSPSSDNNSIKSSVNKINKDPHELSYNSPEQRTQRIQLRMNQWKEKLELMSTSSAVSSSSSVVGGYSPNSGRSSPNPNLNGSFRRRNNRHASFSSTIDVYNGGYDQPFSSARSIYSVNSLPNSVFDEKYDSFAEDDRESVFSLRSSNFHSNFNSNPNVYIPPRSKSSMEVRHPQRSRIYGTGSNSNSPLKESRVHIMQAELENSQRIYKQKLQQINQMRQDLEQYQYKLEEMREKEIEQARQEAIEELENTVIKNLNLEIEALQNKLQETTRELEHSKAYSDMLRNELITLKMNEQSFSVDKIDEEEKYKNGEIKDKSVDFNEETRISDNSQIKENNIAEMENQTKSLELQRLEMLERELKKKNEEIFELKKKLDKSTKLNELSKREIDLLNRKVENHKQAREDIERRHTKLVDVASANEIELNKLRYKLDVLSHRQDKALRKMKKRYSSILEVDEEEEEEEKVEEVVVNVEDNTKTNTLNVDIQPKSFSHHRNSKVEPIHHEKEEEEEKEEESTAFDKETLSESKVSLTSETLDPNKIVNTNIQNENDTSMEVTNILEQTSVIDNTIDDLIDLSDFEKELSDSSNVNSDNLDEILNQLNLSDLDDDEDFNLDDISFDNETLMI